MSQESTQFDIIILGGGMVGAALACACRGRGWRIAVLDGAPPARDWPAGEVDLRVSALSRASQRILERLGAWPRMVELGVSVYREMHVWDAVGGASIHFDSAELGEPDLGHIVENRVTRLALWELLEAADEVTLLCPTQVEVLSISEAGARVVLADGTELDAKLVVGADGRDSLVRTVLGIATGGWGYDQRAIVCNLEPAHWHRETAWQRFLPTGPLAFLPLADGRCSIVWSADEGRAEELLAMDDAAFITELERAFQERLGPILSVGPRAAFPLQMQYAKSYVRPRAALVGDAAHAIHPLAGQGVNLGFLDIAALSDALEHARSHKRDIGGLATLRRYERARRGDNLLMLTAMDAFKRAFGNRIPPLVAARNLGLLTADQLGPLKKAFMRQALGLGEELPSLARADTVGADTKT
ncbi:2-octaprenyl-3-methyl-6-methoxy-1,4-benzoquinol hydroxylase [Thiohalocapsa halophila]|uniref:2-octaprenyl-3-methyl-6-methoxy-1,4-benzoquinol hydroxylase n=1 Tax=Thiohalocapsa halophila TaxID=69359 RepID=A0ABS1CNX4_9GAMM|nr:UbiH/UbiF/VisC/COQ6 family ubiquinone biosynthesis hydroxylase [Thiohalocapsa halophila]MBK1633646.1 2-octaprenyl-3-methyl-6-methoxy-1,4-benzoquinol hydroxylase [Thiohalocapsa halophila]